MNVTVMYIGTFRYDLGLAEEELLLEPEIALEDLLQMLTAKYEGRMGPLVAGGKRRMNFILSLNGRSVASSDWAATKLADGDTVLLAPIEAAG